MKRLLVGLALLALSIPAVVAAQQDTTTVFQTVTVGDLSYKVNPFFVVACFKIKADTSEVWTGTTVETNGEARMQCFYRDTAGAMKPWPEFPTTPDGVLEHTELGEAIYGYPQTAMEPQS